MSFAHPLAVLLVRPNGLERSRFGVTAGRAFAGAAHRNRAKRRAREALRRLAPRAGTGWDVLVIARPAAEQAKFQDLEAVLAKLMEKSGVVRPPQDVERSGSRSQ
jgi:ribonuclease P protein component